jgi:RNA polymerase sigma-70 factor (ECF subfamily)
LLEEGAVNALDPASAVELVRRIAAGDGAAEGELVERCGDALRFLCRRFAREEADAEDLYQETLMVALRKIRAGEVAEPERLAAFLRAVAKNLSIQRYRRRHYAAERPMDAVPEVSDKVDGASGAGREPLEALLQRERVRMTRRLLDEMKVPRDREVLFRYYVAEEESGRICAELGLDGDHFYRVLHRARQRYRQLWEMAAGGSG